MAAGDNTWLIGVALMTVGSIMNNLGNNLMSLGHAEQREIDKLMLQRTNSKEGLLREESDPSIASTDAQMELKNIESELKQKVDKGTWWLTGTIIFVIGALLAFLSFGFAAASLLAALESIQFVSNVFFHKYVHGLVITDRILYSTICIICGNVLVVLFSSHKSEKLSARDITKIYETNYVYHIYLIVSGISWFLAHGVYLSSQAKRDKGDGIVYASSSKFEAFAFVVSATLIGTQSVLHAKCLSMIMQLCIAKDDQFASYHKGTVWCILISWIVTAAIYIHRINRGLQLYSPQFFIPCMTVCFAFFTMVCGGIFFNEFAELSKLAIAFFCIGTLMIFFGVAQLDTDSTDIAVAPVEQSKVAVINEDTPNKPTSSGDSSIELGKEVRNSGTQNHGDGHGFKQNTQRKSILPNPSTVAVLVEHRDEIAEEVTNLVCEVGDKMKEIRGSIVEGVNRIRANSGDFHRLRTLPRGNSPGDKLHSDVDVETTYTDEEAPTPNESLTTGVKVEARDLSSENPTVIVEDDVNTAISAVPADANGNV